MVSSSEKPKPKKEQPAGCTSPTKEEEGDAPSSEAKPASTNKRTSSDLKTEGNMHFKSGDYQKAVDQYLSALALLNEHMEVKEIPLMMTIMSNMI